MFKNSILRYEKARQAVSTLTAERKALIVDCESIDTVPESHNSPYMVEVGQLCLNTAFDRLMSIQADNPGEMYSYSEVLEEMHAGGECCDFCNKSFFIKHTSLAEAKREFGEAKRALSRMGKQIIKNEY